MLLLYHLSSGKYNRYDEVMSLVTQNHAIVYRTLRDCGMRHRQKIKLCDVPVRLV